MNIQVFIKAFCIMLSRWKCFLFVLLPILTLGLATPIYADTQRPLSDWLDAQGSTLVATLNGFNLYRSIYYISSEGLVYAVDNFGVIAKELNRPLPKFDGFVKERALPDGTAEVTVYVHTRDTIIWVGDISNRSLCVYQSVPGAPFCPTLFGRNLADLIALPNTPQLPVTTPVLGDAYFQVKFINPALGAPMPDFATLVFTNNVKFLSITSSAFGELRALYGVPDGTQGRTQLVNIGLFNPGMLTNTDNHVPGMIKLAVIGKEDE